MNDWFALILLLLGVSLLVNILQAIDYKDVLQQLEKQSKIRSIYFKAWQDTIKSESASYYKNVKLIEHIGKLQKGNQETKEEKFLTN